ncbi:MAG TPA: CHAP domain-containing protein [Ktedonobacterales bacterium]|nr:CHAP domain-containing protein [Ktedonobacterales bacterium]
MNLFKPLASKGAVLFVFSLALATAFALVLNMHPALAATDTDHGEYTWPAAPPIANDYFGYYPSSSCPSSDSNCYAFTYTYNGTTYGVSDPWHYALRNCTSYVAWKITQMFPNVSFPTNLGDANTWVKYAQQYNFGTVYPSSNYGPQVGDIAVWTTADHVAYVGDVSNGRVTMYEYNVGLDGNFYSGRTAASIGAPDHYIHIGKVGNQTEYLPTETAFDANVNGGYLYLYNDNTGTTPTTQGIASGTTPAIADTADGYMVAYHGTNGDLWTYDVAMSRATDTGQGMAPGTSPSIAAGVYTGTGANVSGGWEVAFPANVSGNYMYFYEFQAGPLAGNQGLETGTSPAITYVSNNYQEAFAAAGTGNLIVYGSNQNGNTGQGLYPGTSPSISAPFNGSNFEVAFNANTSGGMLYTYNSSGSVTTPTSNSIATGTSPAITALALTNSTYETVFQGSTGTLWIYGDAGNGNTSLGMASGTSASISADGDGSNNSWFAYQNQSNNHLYTIQGANGQITDTQQGMVSSTSPSISAQ